MTPRLLLILILLGAVVAYVDHAFGLQTMLVETIHAMVATGVFIFCLRLRYRHPEMDNFGWSAIVWGLGLLALGSWVDLLDDPPAIALLHIGHVPFGRSWQQAFIKKILGYTGGLGLMALGFFQWIPWMLRTRAEMLALNRKLSDTNRTINRLRLSLEEHLESERLTISRELHDDVAQRLTFMGFQLQINKKELEKEGQAIPEFYGALSQELTDTLKSVRQISRDLRPEPLYALGLITAFEQFLEKMRQQSPELQLVFENRMPASEAAFDTRLSERNRLHLFRILQEGVHNALKHGQASRIEVIVSMTETGNTCFAITDNGKGMPWPEMPPDESLVSEGHLGITGMRERVSELDAELNFRNNTPAPGLTMEVILSP